MQWTDGEKKTASGQQEILSLFWLMEIRTAGKASGDFEDDCASPAATMHYGFGGLLTRAILWC